MTRRRDRPHRGQMSTPLGAMGTGFSKRVGDGQPVTPGVAPRAERRRPRRCGRRAPLIYGEAASLDGVVGMPPLCRRRRGLLVSGVSVSTRGHSDMGLGYRRTVLFRWSCSAVWKASVVGAEAGVARRVCRAGRSQALPSPTGPGRTSDYSSRVARDQHHPASSRAFRRWRPRASASGCRRLPSGCGVAGCRRGHGSWPWCWRGRAATQGRLVGRYWGRWCQAASTRSRRA